VRPARPHILRVLAAPATAARTGTGMTAKERARPASAAAAGSIPAVSTHGSLAETDQRPAETRKRQARSLREPPGRTGLTAKTAAFQAAHRGSTPRYGSDQRNHAPLAQWQSDGLLSRRFGVQVPGGALDGTWGNWQTRPALNREHFQVRSLVSQLCPCSSVGQSAALVRQKHPFDPGQGLLTARGGPDAGPYLGTFTRRAACRSPLASLAQLVSAARLYREGCRFESGRRLGQHAAVAQLE
jgi:hypothetical protein